MNDVPVIGLREGGLIRVEGETHELIGSPARLFLKGRSPVDIEPGGPLWPPGSGIL